MNEQKLRRHLEQHLGVKTDSLQIVPLHQHASYRSYYRAILADGSRYVVMEIPEGKWSVSEEMTNRNLKTRELPFLNVARYLTAKELPVPEVLSEAQAEGLIVLQDLGDETLEKVFRKKSLAEKLSLYQQAISLLVALQDRTDPKSDRCVAFERRFDLELLMWEFEHFFEYGVERRTGRCIAKEDKAFLCQEAERISKQLTELPQVFVHRDYQSRNLMIHDGRFWIIDFQDALLGPITYDLVALLRDSYVVLDRRLRESLIDEYLTQQERCGRKLDRHFFSQMFDWTTIQRKLKDAGRFVFIDQEKGDPSFLPFIPDTLSYVREAFTRRPELKEFYERLKKYVPEWQ